MKQSQIKASAFPKGSEWRRWDLHVHTPESKLGTSFVGVSWDEYVDSLEDAAEKSNIAVIGVTDYMTIDGYERLVAERAKSTPRLSSVALLIPNIEFRASPATKAGNGINLHLLIDPSDPDHIQKIKRALGNLKFHYDGTPYGCSRDQLIEFGKAQNSALGEEAAYKFGIEQFKPTYEEIFKWLATEKWLSANSVATIANGKDGISGLPVGGFAAVRDELLKKSRLIFSGNESDRIHYLGKKDGVPRSEIIRMYGSLKPCVHGSDAHEIGKLFKPDEDRYCWIRSDPTFQGLLQLLWEPEERVHIGPTAPQKSDASRLITEIKISNSRGWFTQSTIALNPGLVAIIGEKGAGKTAVADIVAFASGIPIEDNSQSSFLKKGRLHLDGTRVALRWGTGVETNATLTAKPFEAQRPLVRYLSQDFVERLCSDDHDGGELQEAIEEVVFSYLSDSEKEGHSSFDELRSARELSSQSRQDNFRGSLATLHREIERLHVSIGQRGTKEGTIEQTEKQIAALKQQLPSIPVADADTLILKKLEEERTGLKEAEQTIALKARRKRAIDDLLKNYSGLKERTTQSITDLVSALPANGLVDEGLLQRLNPTWDDSIEDAIRAVGDALESEILAHQGNDTITIPTGKSVFEFKARIKSLEDSLTKDEINKKRLLDLQKQIAEQEGIVIRLRKEIQDIDEKSKKLLLIKERERLDLYMEFFGALSDDETGLRDLYAPMKGKLSALDAEMKFELSAGYRVTAREWMEKATRFYDGRRGVATTTRKNKVEKFIEDTLAPAWLTGDAEAIRPAFEKFIEIVAPVDFMEKVANPSIKMVDLFDWMFSIDHISTTYKIEYGGTALENLSPGTRGIALLVLYLLMDEDDSRPLVIDQPEGNLDNSSIYSQLVPYIRKARIKRQIIIVTHNPNLVVATDADQVVIATSVKVPGQPYPQITYVSGSLEHNEVDDVEGRVGVRQAVCTLLEGGDRAFKDREERYSIKH